MQGSASKYLHLPLLLLAAMVTTLYGCGGDDNSENSGGTPLVESSFGATNSHNEGDNCLKAGCHSEPSSGGKPQFTLAGTVYAAVASNTTLPDVEIELLENGNLIKTIEVNGRGNFYTNTNIAWGNNTSVRVRIDANTTSSAMMTSLTSSSDGGCNNMNGCHTIGQRIAP